MQFTLGRSKAGQWMRLTVIGIVAASIIIFTKPIEMAVLSLSQNYANYLKAWSSNPEWNLMVLPIFAFGGGLIASISPCVLALLPVQLSYLGAQKDKKATPSKVILFGLGIAITYTILGLFTSLAGALIIDHRHSLYISVGVIVIAMALQLKGWGPQLPWHRFRIPALGKADGGKQWPIGALLIGFSFALVSSPCASPVLAAVVSTTTTAGSPHLAITAMFFYAIGYSMLVLLSGLGVELGGLRQRLLDRSEQISGLSALVLFTFGGYYLWAGLQNLSQSGFI